MLIPLKYNVHFFIAIANEHEVTRKKEQVQIPMISKRLFFSKQKSTNRPKIIVCTTMLNKQFCINNVVRASTFHFMNKQHWLKEKKKLLLSVCRDVNVWPKAGV